MNFEMTELLHVGYPGMAINPRLVCALRIDIEVTATGVA